MSKNILKKIYKPYKLVKVKKPSSKTKTENTFGLLERFLNLITPPIAYFLNRLNISADLITLISFGFIGSGAFFF